jgi:hypothetical protein
MLRMKAKMLDYQNQPRMSRSRVNIIEAGYNMHNHTNSCFKRALSSDKPGMTPAEKKFCKKEDDRM